jgi:hypothetical protein
MQQVSVKTVEQSSDKSSFWLGGILFAMRETAGKMKASCDSKSLIWSTLEKEFPVSELDLKRSLHVVLLVDGGYQLHVVSTVQENRDDVCQYPLYRTLLVGEETTVCIFLVEENLSVPPVTFFL